MLKVSSRATDSSDEASVMEVERCGGVVWEMVAEQLGNEDEAVTNPKPYDIPKRRVLEAYWQVRANQGAAGIDGESLEMFEADLSRESLQAMEPVIVGELLPAAGKASGDPEERWRSQNLRSADSC